MTPEEHHKREEQLSPDDAKRLAQMLRLLYEAIYELGKHLKSRSRGGDSPASGESFNID